MSNAAKKALGVNRGIAKSALGGRLGIVKQAGGARKGTLGGRLGGKPQQVQQMGYAGKKARVPVPDADSADTWGHDLYYASGYAASPEPLSEGTCSGTHAPRSMLMHGKLPLSLLLLSPVNLDESSS
jgi:hypothetical protein